MIEMQPKPRSRYQPPRERLAFLLEQLSELEHEFPADAKPKLKLAPKRELNPRESLAQKSRAALKLAPALAIKPIEKPEKKIEPKPKPAPQGQAEPTRKKEAASRSKMVRPVQRSGRDLEAKPKAKAKSKPQREAKTASFGAVLRNSARRIDAGKQPPSRVDATYNPWGNVPQGGLLGVLAKAWSWLNSKYRPSASKKLRLSEMVPLGDKRFVALVVVDDREFLVGGASSGVSLLAQLERPSSPVHAPKRRIGAGGHSH